MDLSTIFLFSANPAITVYGSPLRYLSTAMRNPCSCLSVNSIIASKISKTPFNFWKATVSAPAAFRNNTPVLKLFHSR